MLTRRRFSALATAAAGTALAAPLRLHAAATRSGLEFGVQLYTVRNNLKDLAVILGKIHSIGYASVETFPAVYKFPARELKALIEGQGLKAPAGHFDYPTLEEKVDYAAELGLKTMICPMIPVALWGSLDGFKQGAEHLNKAAAKARAAGLKFGYHPHNYEFRPLQGGRGFDVLMQELDPSVRLELDIFWAAEAGENPLELMRKNRERLALIHIKDRKPGAEVSQTPGPQAAHSITEAGAGTLDWKALLGEARRLGVKQYFVDQDETGLPIEECLRANWKYLSQLSL